jgi:hypothetical protein
MELKKEKKGTLYLALCFTIAGFFKALSQG